MKWDSPIWKKMAQRKRSVYQSLGLTSTPLKPYGMLLRCRVKGDVFLKRLDSFVGFVFVFLFCF